MNWYEIRFKMIADYPDARHKIGKIISGIHAEKLKEFYGCYPHLFKRLLWWEERKEKERPKYVKFRMDYIDFKKGSVVATIDNWHKLKSEWEGYLHFAKDIENKEPNSNYTSIPYSHNDESVCVPATEKQYKNRPNK